jgi:hypothetical protein
MRFRLAICLAISALSIAPEFAHLSLSPRSASASTFVELSVAELVSKSTLVVAGTPLDGTSVWEDSEGGRGRRIVTYTRLRVDRVIDGRAPSEVWIRTLGGHVGDIGQHVDGEAVLAPAQASLLFLHGLSDGTHAVVGMAQGQYPLEVHPDGAPVKLLAPQALGRLLEKLGGPTSDHPPARLVLPGRTLEDAAKLIAAERRAHAP